MWSLRSKNAAASLRWANETLVCLAKIVPEKVLSKFNNKWLDRYYLIAIQLDENTTLEKNITIDENVFKKWHNSIQQDNWQNQARYSLDIQFQCDVISSVQETTAKVIYLLENICMALYLPS